MDHLPAPLPPPFRPPLVPLPPPPPLPPADRFCRNARIRRNPCKRRPVRWAFLWGRHVRMLFFVCERCYVRYLRRGVLVDLFTHRRMRLLPPLPIS